jgi:ACS family hexuronate transporter-like MFS transporter
MLGMIFVGTTVNYIARLVIALLAPTLQLKYHISDSAYGYIGSSFAIAYAIGQIFSGSLLDLVGTRIGYFLSIVTWSFCAMLTALGFGPISFAICRALLGICESPSYPAAAKICAEWFPRRQRAFAFGWVNAGSNMATIVTLLMVPWLTIHFGWKSAFIWTGALGLPLSVAWIIFYRLPENHRWISPGELAMIKSDPPESTIKLPWSTVVTYRQAWVFAVGKFFTDGIWWFFMTWIPKFFSADPYNIPLSKIGWPLVVIYLMADVGAVGGGLISSGLMRGGQTVNRSRKTAMLISAFLAVPIIFAPHIHSLWPAVIIVGLAVSGHQGFSSNLYTLCSDLFPKNVVASIAGLGGFCGYVGASIFQAFTGNWVQYTHNYYGPFFCAGIAYLLALTLMHLLSRDLRAIVLPEETPVPIAEITYATAAK